MKQILIPVSGGIDSTFVLWKYLTETNYPIHAHHINLYSKQEFRVHQEQSAVDSIKDWLKHNCRDFRYSQSSYINSLGGSDITLALFTMSQICYHLLGSDTDEIIVATGRCKEDDIRNPDTVSQDNIFWAGIKDIDVPIKLERPIRHLSKKEIIGNMPQELSELTWSCRSPKFVNGKAIECGKCHACKEKN